MKRLLLVPVVCALVAASAVASEVGVGVALALPGKAPDSILGTNGQVRALLQVGNVMWVGGQFTATSNGRSGLSNIVGLDVSTGKRAASVVRMPQLRGPGSIVYDLATDGKRVYAAGKFNAANGAENLVAFDAVTGRLKQKFIAPVLRSVLFRDGRVLGGGTSLRAWLPRGGRDRSWDVTTVHIDDSLRAHTTKPAYRDLMHVPGGGYFAACQCDSLTDDGTTYQTKAIVRLNADGGYHAAWKPGGSNPLGAGSGAFGIDVFVDSRSVVLAAGGSDFTAKYDLITGDRIWRTDTNGSSQAVIRFTDAHGSNYIVGGHYRCLSGTASAGNQNDVFHPRLSALAVNGVLDRSWTIPVTPNYNGVWVVAQDRSGRLWIGGEFRKVGGRWSGDSTNTCANGRPTAVNQTSHRYLARFS
jgi:hypothetical protein